ncbi:MAG: MFS transporter [Pseudomonadota bacterium]
MAQPYPQPCDRGVIVAQPCPRELETEPDAATKRWTLIACVLASALALIDGSALTVALPALARDFEVPLNGLHWVINGYVLALASMTLAGGALADARGRRRMLITGCVLFGVTSAACALAPSLAWLIAARVFQGIAAAIVTPASLALIGEVFPKDERNRAIGTWAAASALTTAAGPALGGWLTDTLGWAAVFWINPPLALLAIVILVRFGSDGPRQQGHFDWLGSVLLAAAMAAAAYALADLAPSETGAVAGDGRTLAIVMCVSAVALGAAFVFWERRAKTPMMPPSLFRRPNFTALNLATVLIYAGLSVVFFLIPFDLIDARGLTAAQAGLVFLPFTLALGFLSRLSGALIDELGARPLLVAGPMLAGVSFLGMGLFRDASLIAATLVPMLAAGVGFAMLVAPLTAGVMAAVDERDAGLASGLNNTASRIAQLLGVALAAGIAPLASGYVVALSLAAALTMVGGLVLVGVREV